TGGQFANGAMTVNVVTLSRPWVQGTSQDNWSPGAGSSWLNAATGTPWTTPGGDFNTAYNFGNGANGIVTSATIPSFNGANWVSFNVTAAVQAWASGSLANDGFAFVIT